MNLFDILRLDSSELDHEQQEILFLLKRIGLSDYESKAYLALVMRMHGSAEEVAEVAIIPRTSAYKVLESLKQKGFATSSGGRPVVYYTVPPSEVKDKLVSDVDKVFQKLELLQGVLSEKGTPQLVYTITGKEKVLAKIGEMLDEAKESFFLSSPSLLDIIGMHSPRFTSALKRGVKITIVTEPSSKVPEATEVLRKHDLLATDAVSDSELAMIASPDLSICGYTDNPFLSAHLENFFKMSLEKIKGNP